VTTRPSLHQLKALYDRGVNLMDYLRQSEASDENTWQAILMAYELQAGSYIDIVSDPANQALHQQYAGQLSEILNDLSIHTIMEAGVGEATLLTDVVAKLTQQPQKVLGFDISWSRLACAPDYTHLRNIDPMLFVGNLLEIPVVSNAVDVVYTSHSIEPNGGREKEILRELFRVARRYVVLLEPSNELGSAATKNRIDRLGYCKDLYRHATDLGYHVLEHRLFDVCVRPENQTALMVIEKEPISDPQPDQLLGCPMCNQQLTLARNNYFCNNCLVIFPLIDHIPCLLTAHAVVGSKYLERHHRSAA